MTTGGAHPDDSAHPEPATGPVTPSGSSGSNEQRGDDVSRRMLAGMAARHGRQPRLGCSTIAHRDLGFCARCIDSPSGDPRLGASYELSGWRLLAMAQRGM